MAKNDRLSLINDIYEVGIYIRIICLSGHRKYPLGSNDENVREKSLNIMQKPINLDNDLGIRIVPIAAVHLKENVLEKFSEIPFGTGHVDFKSVIKKYLDLEVRKFVAEFWHCYGKIWKI